MNEECSSRTKFVNVCKIIFYIKLVAQTCVELEGCTRKVSQFLYTAKVFRDLKVVIKICPSHNTQLSSHPSPTPNPPHSPIPPRLASCLLFDLIQNFQISSHHLRM